MTNTKKAAEQIVRALISSGAMTNDGRTDFGRMQMSVNKLYLDAFDGDKFEGMVFDSSLVRGLNKNGRIYFLSSKTDSDEEHISRICESFEVAFVENIGDDELNDPAEDLERGMKFPPVGSTTVFIVESSPSKQDEENIRNHYENFGEVYISGKWSKEDGDVYINDELKEKLCQCPKTPCRDSAFSDEQACYAPSNDEDYVQNMIDDSLEEMFDNASCVASDFSEDFRKGVLDGHLMSYEKFGMDTYLSMKDRSKSESYKDGLLIGYIQNKENQKS